MIHNFLRKQLGLKNLTFAIIAILFVIFIAKIQDIAIMFFASYVIACSLEPVVARLSNKMPRQRAALFTLIGVLLIIGVVLVPVIALSASEIKTFTVSFPTFIDKLDETLQHSAILAHTPFAQFDLDKFASSAAGVTSDFIEHSVEIIKELSSAVVYFIISILIIYYFMADKEIIRKTSLRLFPKHLRKRADEIMNIISEKIGGYVAGQLIAVSSIGIIMTIGLILLGVDYGFLLGLITAILDFIPVVGPAIGLAICIIACYEAGGKIIVGILVIFAIAQIVENNLVRPYVFSKLLNLHPILIFLSLFLTAKYMGILGVIFAPAIAATVCVLIEELYMKNLE